MMLARKRIRRVLSFDPEIEVIGECSDGRQAIEAIQNQKPDLLFLDIQMPEVSGFEVIEKIGAGQMPKIIFVTAFDEFALRAFEVHAFDYLLKPFEVERMQATLARAKAQILKAENSGSDERLLALVKTIRESEKYLKRLTIKARGKTIFLTVDEIDCIISDGNYLNLHIGNQTHLIRAALRDFENKLDPEKFVRTHRSSIVNLDRIKEMHPLFNGDQLIIMQNGREVLLSRNYRRNFKELFESF